MKLLWRLIIAVCLFHFASQSAVPVSEQMLTFFRIKYFLNLYGQNVLICKVLKIDKIFSDQKQENPR